VSSESFPNHEDVLIGWDLSGRMGVRKNGNHEGVLIGFIFLVDDGSLDHEWCDRTMRMYRLVDIWGWDKIGEGNLHVIGTHGKEK
jgi:hypothetical protein